MVADADEYTSLAAAVADCTLGLRTTAIWHRELQQPLWTLQDATPQIYTSLGAEESRVALVFGSEKFGLSNESLNHCHGLLHIPTREENYSMNLGQAVAVCLYELARSGSQTTAPTKQPQPATAGEIERLLDVLLEVLNASNYGHAQPTENIEDQTRRLVLRFNLCSRDVEILLGMLRRILWKVEDKKPPQA